MKDNHIAEVLDRHVSSRVPTLETLTHFVNESDDGKYYLSIFSGVDGDNETHEEFEAWKQALAELGIDGASGAAFHKDHRRSRLWHTYLVIIKKDKLEELLQSVMLES